MGYGVWELRGNFSTKCFDVAKLGMGLVSCPMLTNRLNKQQCQLKLSCIIRSLQNANAEENVC